MNLLEQMTGLAKKLETITESSSKENYKRIHHYGLTEIYRGKNTTDIYHGGNMGNTLDDIKENVDKMLGSGTFDKLLKYGKQEGSPVYSYSLYVPNKYYDQIVSSNINESSTKDNKCKSCKKSCTKTYCSKACKDKITEGFRGQVGVPLKDGSDEVVLLSHSGDYFIVPNRAEANEYGQAVKDKDWDKVLNFEEGWTGWRYLKEAWDTKMHTAKKDKGMFKGKTKAELKSELEKLKKNPNKSAAHKKKEKQIMFALRAKNKFGKINENSNGFDDPLSSLTLRGVANGQDFWSEEEQMIIARHILKLQKQISDAGWSADAARQREDESPRENW